MTDYTFNHNSQLFEIFFFEHNFVGTEGYFAGAFNYFNNDFQGRLLLISNLEWGRGV